MIIPDVATFRRLASEGRAGNTPRIWNSLDSFIEDDSVIEQRTFAFVSSSRADNFRLYQLKWGEVLGLRTEADMNKGFIQHPSRPVRAHIDDLFAMESPDPKWQESRHSFQFDWVPDERYLIWDVSNRPWGERKRAGLYTTSEGARAMSILRSHLGDSFDDLEEIDAKYPGAIVEATYFGAPLGVYRRPLLIWEVRHY